MATFCKNAHPHVTISHAAGTAAVYSNELLEQAAPEPPAGSPTVGSSTVGSSTAGSTAGGVLVLSGVVGVMVEKAQGLDLLTPRLRQQVRGLRSGGTSP